MASGLLAALGLVFFMQWLGLSRAVDSRLYELFYELRGERSSQKRVLLIEVDDASIHRLGPLPWSQEHYVDLISQITRGSPRLIAFVEPSSLVWTRDASDRDEVLAPVIMPPIHPSRTDEPLKLGTERQVAYVPLYTEQGPPTPFAELIKAAGYDLPMGERLPINYLGPEVQAPVLSAVSVIDGNISAQAFDDKIVLIGRAHTETAMSLPTPIGAMTMAEIHAHALLGIDDGVAWWQPPDEWIWLFVAFYAVTLMLVMYRRPVRTLFTILSIATLGPVICGYIGFATGELLVAVSDLMITALAAFTVAFVVSEANGRARLATLAHEVTRSVSHDGLSEDRFWLRVSKLAELYTDARSSMLAALPPGTPELTIQALSGAGAQDIAEKNRNVRNPPFRQAYNTKQPDVVEGFMVEGDQPLRTMLVPLVVRLEVIGFWILNFAQEELPDGDQEKLIASLAEQIGYGLARRREEPVRKNRRRASAAPSRDTLLATVDNVDRGMSNILLERRLTHSMLEEMPIGMVTAAPWLDIELSNQKMQEVLGDANIKIAEASDLSTLLGKLTGKPSDEVDRQIRQVVESKSPVTFTIADSDYTFTLSWVYTANRSGAVPLARLLLIANHGTDHSENTVETGAFDVRIVVMHALNLIRVMPDLPERVIRIDLVDPMPRALGSPETTEAALIAMLRDTAVHGSPEMPCTLAVECEEDQIIITVSDPTYSIPASAVEALLRESGQSDNTQSSLAAIQRRLQAQEGAQGHIEVDSFYGSGIVFRLQLPLET